MSRQLSVPGYRGSYIYIYLNILAVAIYTRAPIFNDAGRRVFGCQKASLGRIIQKYIICVNVAPPLQVLFKFLIKYARLRAWSVDLTCETPCRYKCERVYGLPIYGIFHTFSTAQQ